MGPANKWYKVGFDNIQEADAAGEKIQILTAPCFLATKFEAFKDRGGDHRMSHDFEDIIYVLDNRINIVQEILEGDPQVYAFLKEELRGILNMSHATEILSCHIHPLVVEERFPVLLNKIQTITES